MIKKCLLAAALLIGFSGVSSAQQGSLIQQSASRLDASTNVAVGTNFNTVNSTSVATATGVAGQYVYLTGLVIDLCGDTTGTAATPNLLFTSSGIAGSPSWQYADTAALSLSTCKHWGETFTIPLKASATGTNVVVTSPAALLHTGYGIKIFYYTAP